MNKNRLLGILSKNEDSVITIRISDEEADFFYKRECSIYEKEQKGEQPKWTNKIDIACTTNFDNGYIKSLRKRKFNTNGNVLVFSWTENKFRIVNPKDVINIMSMASILKNKKPELNNNA